MAGRKSEEDKRVDAVVLSHARSDHAGYISFLREDIPIWMGKTAKEITDSVGAETYSTIEFEISGFKKRPMDRSSKINERIINIFRTRQKFSIDSIEVEPVHVDHSIPGCHGFVVRTSNSAIVYSGDLRMHGTKPELTRDFVDTASSSKPNVMVCEETRINESFSSREKDIPETCKYYVTRAKESFVFADYSYKDLDRFPTMYALRNHAAENFW